MKLLLVLTATLALVVAYPDETTYDPRFDNFNIDDVISSNRLMKSYAKCFLGDGKCSPDGNNFKKLIPEVIDTTCGKCSEKQKVLIAKVLRALKDNLSEDFNKLYAKYDPQNKRRQELDEFIEKYGKSQ